MTDERIIEVVRAHMEGKQIQYSYYSIDGITDWLDADERDYPKCHWNFQLNNYRVKPEPRKPREWMVYVSPSRNEIFNLPFEGCDDPIRVREVIE